MKIRKLLWTAVLGAFFQVGGVQAALLDLAGLNSLKTHLGESNITVTQIYARANDDGGIATWHEKVDNKGRTFTLLEILVAGPAFGSSGTFSGPMIIGGYNPSDWDSVGGYNFVEDPLDRSAFLFNLTLSIFQDQKKTAEGQYETLNEAIYGPTFGGGPDLFVDNDFFGTLSPYSYGADSAQIGALGPNILGETGVWNITVNQMETYSIITPPPSVVPLPSSAILFGTALLGLGAMRRRRRKLKAVV